MTTADALLWVYAGALVAAGLALALGRFLFRCLFPALLVVVLSGAEPPRAGFKPCPFCHEDQQHVFRLEYQTEYYGTRIVTRWASVRCRLCLATGPNAEGKSCEQAMARALYEWNWRQSQSSLVMRIMGRERCAFCTSTLPDSPRFIHEIEWYGGIPVARWSAVQCLSCTAVGPAATGSDWLQADDRAMARWNQRTGP